MDASDAAPRELRYDAFISYSRKDRAFTKRLERELRRYRPPKDLPVPQRYFRVFRDEEDFTGTEYHESLDRNLRDSAKLIVICSPNSASSHFVADEIRRFAQHRGKEHIVPILLDGIPNDEATGSDQARRAFPEELVRLLPMPLAADYRGFSPAATIRKGAFARAWFKTLADLYADSGIDRATIERREGRREAQRLRNIAAVSGSVAVALIALTIWALLSRNEATRQRDNSEARRNEAEARLAFDGSADALVKAALLSVASVHFGRTVDGHLLLARLLALLPRPPLWRQPGAVPRVEGTGGGRRRALAFSRDGRRIVSAGGAGPVRLLDAHTGQIVASRALNRQPADRTVAVFSPDGRFVVLGCGHVACVVDVSSGQLVTPLPPDGRGQAAMVWAACFSPDGTRLAISGYGSGEVFIYDVSTWRIVATLKAGSSSIFSIAFSTSGQWLATAAQDGLLLWRAGEYIAPAARVSTPGIIWSIAFQPDGSGFVTAAQTVQAWRIVAGASADIRIEAARAAPIEAHTVLPLLWHGQACFAAATPLAVHVLCGDSLVEVLRIPVSSVAATVSPDGRLLLNEQNDGTLAAWPLEAGLEAFRVRIGAPVHSIVTADAGGWLAAGTQAGEVVVLGLDTWKVRVRLHLPSPVTHVNASNDGRWLAAVEGRSVHVFDARRWLETNATTYPDAVRWAGFDSAGRALVIRAGETVVVVQPGTWREQLRVAADGAIEAVRVSPDASRLVTVTHFSSGGHDGGVFLTRAFDVARSTETGWEYTTGGGSNISEQFMKAEAARHQRKLVGGDPAELRKAASSWPALELSEPSERASLDNAWRAHVSGSSVDLNDVTADRLIAAFDHIGEISAVRFVPGLAPRWLVSAGEDGTLAMWPLRTDDLADLACLRLQAMLGARGMEQLIADAHIERSCTATMAGHQ